jgi:hypothetical protein
MSAESSVEVAIAASICFMSIGQLPAKAGPTVRAATRTNVVLTVSAAVNANACSLVFFITMVSKVLFQGLTAKNLSKAPAFR